jgi:hypothetical protein
MDMMPLIYQMCAARLAQSNDPAAAQLLARMNSTDGSALPDLREFVQSMAGSNPAMQFLAQHLETLRASPAEEQGVTIEGVAEPSDGDDPGAAAALLELRAQVDSMFEELTMLRRRNEDLALALGACPACWGEDSQCRFCRGQGAPGFSRPDTAAFLHYVVPAGKTWRLFRGVESNVPHSARARREAG